MHAHSQLYTNPRFFIRSPRHFLTKVRFMYKALKLTIQCTQQPFRATMSNQSACFQWNRYIGPPSNGLISTKKITGKSYTYTAGLKKIISPCALFEVVCTFLECLKKTTSIEKKFPVYRTLIKKGVQFLSILNRIKYVIFHNV